MLFSQPKVAALLNERFECAWESVREVPKVTIDFGGGTVLHRTLVGNIATWFCCGDGEAFGVIPGLVDADEMLASSTAALQAYADGHAGQGPSGRERAREALLLRAMSLAAATAPTLLLRSGADVSKRGVEDPLRRAAGMPPANTEATAVPAPDASKRAVERPLRLAAGVPAPEDVVAADAAFNRGQRYLEAQGLLLQRSPTTPAMLRDELFERILHVPLQDPFLGLAPMTPGGEGGRVVGGTPLPSDR